MCCSDSFYALHVPSTEVDVCECARTHVPVQQGSCHGVTVMDVMYGSVGMKRESVMTTLMKRFSLAVFLNLMNDDE